MSATNLRFKTAVRSVRSDTFAIDIQIRLRLLRTKSGWATADEHVPEASTPEKAAMGTLLTAVGAKC